MESMVVILSASSHLEGNIVDSAVRQPADATCHQRDNVYLFSYSRPDVNSAPTTTLATCAQTVNAPTINHRHQTPCPYPCVDHSDQLRQHHDL
nr:unnamed protein product [Spirometra erinaceieuropaei]